jgi:UDP-N-acetylglucosamine 1-carboxyvinyltransferase
MSRFIIRGRRPLSGAFVPAGNKNAVLPMLAACLLTDQPLRLQNVPAIEDVRTMLDILGRLGVAVEEGPGRVTLCAASLKSRQPPRDLCARVRSSILLAGPLAARHGRALLYPPGGDIIGRRRLDTHFLGLRALGIEADARPDRLAFRRQSFRGSRMVLDEASVTATENILMAAVLAPGETEIYNAACEPHVQDLGLLLRKMGATIEGLGTNRLRVRGVQTLNGAEHDVCPDHIEAGSFLLAAAATGGRLRLEGLPTEAAGPMRRAFEVLGSPLADGRGGGLSLVPARARQVRRDAGSAIPKIEDGPWPAFPTDLMSVAIVAATQARGLVLFFEKMFESRMVFVDRLLDMGARIIRCDPHRVLVSGPTPLHACRVASPDIRAGMAMIVAALCARGVSVIENAQVIDRGYERIEERLRTLGADIAREP